jgi:general stress protein 14
LRVCERFSYGDEGGNLKWGNFMSRIMVGAPEQDYRADGKAHFLCA